MNQIQSLKTSLRAQLLAAGVSLMCIDFTDPNKASFETTNVSYVDANGQPISIESIDKLSSEVDHLMCNIARIHPCDGGSITWFIDTDDLRIDVFTRTYQEKGGWDELFSKMAESESNKEAASEAVSSSPVPGQSKTETSVLVKYWDCYEDPTTVVTHQLDIDDQRSNNGQAFVTLGAIEGNLDDMLSVTMEVNTNPLTGIDHVPCAHIHFDNDSVAVSLFKIGDKILMRPESGVTIERISGLVGEFSEKMFWLD